MANIMIKSFQVLAEEDAYKEFQYNDAYKIQYGKVNGRRSYLFCIPVYIGNKGGGTSVFVDSAQCYTGLRMLNYNLNGGKYHIGLSDKPLSTTEDDMFLKCTISENGISLPDKTVIPSPKIYYLEVGFDGVYGEIRIDGTVIYRGLYEVKKVTYWRLYGHHVSVYAYIGFQDFYINNGEGQFNNSFWGDVKINALPAVSVHSTNGFINSDGTEDNLQDYVGIPSDKSKFLNTKEKDSKILFDMTDIPSDQNPLAMAVTSGLIKVDIGSFSVNPVISLSGKEVEEILNTLPVNYYTSNTVNFNSAPDGLPWSAESLNQVLCGAVVREISDG